MRPAITDIRGIAKSGAAALAGAGIKTLAQLAKASKEQITGIRGFGAARAVNAIKAAKAMMPPAPAVAK